MSGCYSAAQPHHLPAPTSPRPPSSSSPLPQTTTNPAAAAAAAAAASDSRTTSPDVAAPAELLGDAGDESDGPLSTTPTPDGPQQPQQQTPAAAEGAASASPAPTLQVNTDAFFMSLASTGLSGSPPKQRFSNEIVEPDQALSPALFTVPPTPNSRIRLLGSPTSVTISPAPVLGGGGSGSGVGGGRPPLPPSPDTQVVPPLGVHTNNTAFTPFNGNSIGNGDGGGDGLNSNHNRIANDGVNEETGMLHLLSLWFDSLYIYISRPALKAHPIYTQTRYSTIPQCQRLLIYFTGRLSTVSVGTNLDDSTLDDSAVLPADLLLPSTPSSLRPSSTDLSMSVRYTHPTGVSAISIFGYFWMFLEDTAVDFCPITLPSMSALPLCCALAFLCLPS